MFRKQEKDIQLIKINSDFDIKWIKQVDAEGLTDTAGDLVVNSEGDIIIVGNSVKENTGTEITISKFSAAGDEKLRRSYIAPVSSDAAEVAKVTVSNDDWVF